MRKSCQTLFFGFVVSTLPGQGARGRQCGVAAVGLDATEEGAVNFFAFDLAAVGATLAGAQEVSPLSRPQAEAQ